MTPRVQAEITTKCRRLFYDKLTGLVTGVASGGGALEELTGAALIIATHNDADAPNIIGCVECYYSPLGKGPPYSVDLAKVPDMESTSAAYRMNPSDVTAQALFDARDAAVVYAVPVRTGGVRDVGRGEV